MMESMNAESVSTRASDADGLSEGLNELARRVDWAVGADEIYHRMGPVWVHRVTQPTEPSHALYGPMFCVIAQGRKQVTIGGERYVYDAGRFLLNSVTLPAVGQVIEATSDNPCLGLMIEIDPAIVVSVLAELGPSALSGDPPLRAMEAGHIDATTLDVVIRIARLLEAPKDRAFLFPLLQRELVYRLFQGPSAARLRQIAAPGGQTQRVVRAVEWLRDHYHQPMMVDDLARECGLSASALHHHFKEVTAMSPLQFQKQMRLQEANRLMLAEGLDAASAGFRVGYEDPAYFSREYRRFFGDPPRRHVERVQQEMTGASALPVG